MTRHTPSLILGILLLSACADKDANKAEPVFQGQAEALEKARKVEDSLLEHKQQQDRLIDAQSR